MFLQLLQLKNEHFEISTEKRQTKYLHMRNYTRLIKRYYFRNFSGYSTISGTFFDKSRQTIQQESK